VTGLDDTYLVRLEYLTPAGWAVGHSGLRLLHPAKYVERKQAKEKVARAVELGDDMQPTGRVWEPENMETSEETQDTGFLARRGVASCANCGESHPTPWECLL
jgi:hypothetical protein